MRDGKLGIYCHPDAVAQTPDYAKRLVEVGGVDYFILRSGYNFGYPESQAKAVQVIRDLGVKVSFMVGVLWGGWNQDVPTPSKSQEALFHMDMPGNEETEPKFLAKIDKLLSDFTPDSLNLTHVRYRHPAYIDAIFDEGSKDAGYQARMASAGIPRSDMLAARGAWEKAMGSLDKAALLKATEKGFVDFLSDLSQDDALKRLLAFRRTTVSDSMAKYKKVVDGHGVSFGCNAFSPYGTMITGQDYDGTFAEMCDFVQPLLCYMEWHRYESIAAWARYLMLHTGLNDEAAAIRAALNLFNMGSNICPDNLNELDTCLEGTNESTLSFGQNEINMCKPFVNKPYELQIVFRGKQWDHGITDQLIAEAKDIGVKSFIFNGCEYLSKMQSPVIQSKEPGVGWT